MGEWRIGQIVLVQLENGMAMEQALDDSGSKRRRIGIQEGELFADIIGDTSPGTTDKTEIARQLALMLEAHNEYLSS